MADLLCVSGGSCLPTEGFRGLRGQCFRDALVWSIESIDFRARMPTGVRRSASPRERRPDSGVGTRTRTTRTLTCRNRPTSSALVAANLQISNRGESKGRKRLSKRFYFIRISKFNLTSERIYTRVSNSDTFHARESFEPLHTHFSTRVRNEI